MNKSKSKYIALLAVLGAILIVVFVLESVVGAVLVAPPAVLSLTVFFVFCFCADWKIGLLSGAVFGVSSLVIAWIIGNPIFILPWVSILPRLIVGIGAFGVMAGVRKLCLHSKSKFVNQVLPYSIGAACGIVFNTVLVLLSMAYLVPAELGLGTFVQLLQTSIGINFIIEFVCAITLTPVLLLAVRKAGVSLGIDQVGTPKRKIKTQTENKGE